MNRPWAGRGFTMIDRPRRLLAVLAGLLVLVLASRTAVRAERVSPLLDFAQEMAARGHWREAGFRWQRAASIDPGNPRILNNLAVAHEALGEFADARDLYAEALALSPGDPVVQSNASGLERFLEETKKADEEPDRPARRPHRGGKKKKSKNIVQVSLKVPLPPRLDLSGVDTVLVASFRTNDTDLVDVNREIVRFLRSEFRKHTALQVLDVTPAPAVPEQSLSDLAANSEFWKRLGREHGADLVVSGILRYGRRDASGFRDVDEIDSITGQKVRRTRYVEQELFEYELDVLFLDGATGELRFQDKLRRRVVYGGQANDPITAFYQISEAVGGDVLAVVSPRTREETRSLFRK